MEILSLAAKTDDIVQLVGNADNTVNFNFRNSHGALLLSHCSACFIRGQDQQFFNIIYRNLISDAFYNGGNIVDLSISEENVGKKHYRRMGGKVNIVLAGDKFYPLRQLIHEIVLHISGLFPAGGGTEDGGGLIGGFRVDQSV